MLFIRSNSTNTFFNLATEEYFLKNSNENIFFLWISGPSVVVGKHQNTLAEINYKYVIDNNITIARRLSGGGTVVHDLQNLNFTFIANGEQGKLVDFKKFVTPIINYLSTLGIKAHIGEKNDIRIGDLKISGNAEHIYKNRVLHHGTLLFNSNLDMLKNAIAVEPGIYFDKAVQSNRAKVTNISSHLKSNLNIETFIAGLCGFIKMQKPGIINHYLSETDVSAIKKLVKEKYNTVEWVFGYSPKYRFVKDFVLSDVHWEIGLNVEKGIIKEAQVLQNKKELIIFSQSLPGKYHLIEPVKEAIKNVIPPTDYTDLNELAYSFI